MKLPDGDLTENIHQNFNVFAKSWPVTKMLKIWKKVVKLKYTSEINEVECPNIFVVVLQTVIFPYSSMHNVTRYHKCFEWIKGYKPGKGQYGLTCCTRVRINGTPQFRWTGKIQGHTFKKEYFHYQPIHWEPKKKIHFHYRIRLNIGKRRQVWEV